MLKNIFCIFLIKSILLCMNVSRPLTGECHGRSSCGQLRIRGPAHASGWCFPYLCTAHLASLNTNTTPVTTNLYYITENLKAKEKWVKVFIPSSMARDRHSWVVFTSFLLLSSTFPTKKVSFRSPWQPLW